MCCVVVVGWGPEILFHCGMVGGVAESMWIDLEVCCREDNDLCACFKI